MVNPLLFLFFLFSRNKNESPFLQYGQEQFGSWGQTHRDTQGAELEESLLQTVSVRPSTC